MTKAVGPDTTREYRTRAGDRVVLHDFVPHNSLGNIVTFPIKGTIIDKDHPRRKKFQIWTTEGRACVFKPSPEDIIDMPPVVLAEACPCADCDATEVADNK
jgi:hypothetical protein